MLCQEVMVRKGKEEWEGERGGLVGNGVKSRWGEGLKRGRGGWEEDEKRRGEEGAGGGGE